jgi:hypothetical protein
MTIEELAKLSDEELRFKCAELCGWTRLNWNTWEHKDSRMSVWPTTSVPNYPADLNAMHEAEKTLRFSDDGDRSLDAYEKALKRVHFKDDCDEIWNPQTAETCIWHATARQRCIAFIAVKQQPVEVKGGGE